MSFLKKLVLAGFPLSKCGLVGYWDTRSASQVLHLMRFLMQPYPIYAGLGPAPTHVTLHSLAC